jgi:hypothetical protein
MNKINDKLAPNVEKGFKVSDIKDLDTMAGLKRWIEFYKLMELEKEETVRHSQGNFKHTLAMVESSSGRQLAKRPQKEVTNMGKKKLGKFVMGKEVKGFDPIKCYIKDITIGEDMLIPFHLALPLSRMCDC